VSKSTKPTLKAQVQELKESLVAMQKNILRCSFCGKGYKNVDHLICGPRCFICNECVIACVQILAHECRKKIERVK